MARSRKNRTKLVTEIQLTSFMDLTFLLLIVFILTAPMLEYGVDVSPPKMNADPVTEDKSVVVTLNAKGGIQFQKETVSLAELSRKLAFMSGVQPDLPVLIRADRRRAYGEVVEVMRAIRGARVRSVSLVTEAEDL